MTLEPRTTLPGPRDEVALRFDEPQVIVRVMLTPDRAIDDFLGDCRRRRWSERSIRSYSDTLYRFEDRLADDLDVSQLKAEHFRRYLTTRSHLAAGTVANEEAHLSSWCKWMFKAKVIVRNPFDELDRTKRIPAEDLDVITVDVASVPLLLAAARPGTERNATAIASYLGPRRHAIALLRDTDYDGESLRFREKGSKTIEKKVPVELATVLDASIARGEIRAAPHNYLVPPEGYLSRRGDRDDRVIWRVIKRVADRAGVDAHVHALRAAFAVFYLEQNHDQADALLGLKELLGHRSLNTTLVYLRKLNKQVAMGRVRTLSWAAITPGGEAAWLSQSPRTSFVASSAVGAGGFEPPSDDPSPGKPRGDEPASVKRSRVALERARLLAELAALDSRDRDPEAVEATRGTEA